jgi:hypothetical protein
MTNRTHLAQPWTVASYGVSVAHLARSRCWALRRLPVDADVGADHTP